MWKRCYGKHKRTQRNSKLIQDIQSLFRFEHGELQLHCAVYKNNTYPRYWLQLRTSDGDSVIVWDFPKDFMDKPDVKCGKAGWATSHGAYSIDGIADCIESYINLDRLDVINRTYEPDMWGLYDIFRAADRRLGKARLVDIARGKYGEPAAMVAKEALRITEAKKQ